MNKFRKEEEPSDLFEIAGVKYYFDLDQLTQFIRIEKPESVDDILGEAKKELAKNKADAEKAKPEDSLFSRAFSGLAPKTNFSQINHFLIKNILNACFYDILRYSLKIQ